MKREIKRILAVGLCLGCLIGMVSTGAPSEAKKKTKVKTIKCACQVVSGGSVSLKKTRNYTMKYCPVTVKDKTILKAVKDKRVNTLDINPGNQDEYYGVIVYGKKPGVTKVTAKIDNKKFIYTVTVLDPEPIRQEAAAALAPLVEEAKAKPDSKWVYADLNGDGIEDLFVDGTMSAYEYNMKKIITCGTGINPAGLGAIYTSAEKQMIYFEAASGSSVTTDDPGTGTYSGISVGQFFVFDEQAIFKQRLTIDVLQYAHPEEFLTKKVLKTSDVFFCFYDSTYDQDDLWYEYYTRETLEKKIDKIMPDKVRVL